MDPVGLRGPATHTSHDCHLSPEVGHHWKLLLLDRSHADVVTFSPEGGSSNPAAGSRTLPETSEVVPYSAETATYSPGIGTQSPEVGTYSPEAAAAGSCHSLAGSCRLLLRCSLLAGSRRLSLFRRRLPLTLRSCHLLTGSRASPESPEIVTFSPSVVTYSPEVVHAPLSGGVFSERQTGLPYRDGCAEVSRLQREREREREIEIDNVCVCWQTRTCRDGRVRVCACVCPAGLGSFLGPSKRSGVILHISMLPQSSAIAYLRIHTTAHPRCACQRAAQTNHAMQETTRHVPIARHVPARGHWFKLVTVGCIAMPCMPRPSSDLHEGARAKG